MSGEGNMQEERQLHVKPMAPRIAGAAATMPMLPAATPPSVSTVAHAAEISLTCTIVKDVKISSRSMIAAWRSGPGCLQLYIRKTTKPQLIPSLTGSEADS